MPRLLEDSLGVPIDIAWLVLIGLDKLAHFSASDDIDVLSFVSLLPKLAATCAHGVLDLLGQSLELLVSKFFENWNFAQILEHLVFFARLLLPEEVVKVSVREVHNVSVLRRPDRCEAATRANFSEVLLFLIVAMQRELAKVGASAQVSENYLDGLSGYIHRDW